ncbi:MAG TPA: amino acid ABC transporter permease [Acidimicrobiia bacterium]|nr:amino acid ABC transporter permease [Acidimicrobiia bacterium]
MTEAEASRRSPGMSPGRARRLAFHRRQRRRSLLIGAASSIVVFGTVTLVVVNSSGWEQVRQSFFSWEDFQASFPDILSGFGRNVRIFLIAEVFILVVSLLLAVIRSSRSPVLTPLRLAATAYVDLIRGIPTIILLFLLGFGVPALRLQGVPNSQEFWAITTLVISYSAYVAEVYRAGIDSVHDSQTAAARSLGLSSAQSMRWVVLPQAVRRVIPPLLNDFVALQKDSALLALLGVQEAFRRAQIYVAGTFNFTAYLAAALLFLILTIPLARYTDYLIRRQRERVGGTSL